MTKRRPRTPPAEPHNQPFDFTSDITWRMFRIMSEFTEGLEMLANLKRPVTFFGSARTPRTSRYYISARRLARQLGRAGFTIITGGGPGIMEAANRGAWEAKAESVGLNIQLPTEQRINRYVKKGMGFAYFFSRKTMLSTSAQAYIFFPGGYGTLDEFFTIATLMQTRKIERRPLVLYGRQFWGPLNEFIRRRMFKVEKAISPRDTTLYTIVDRVPEAAKIILASKERVYTSM